MRQRPLPLIALAVLVSLFTATLTQAHAAQTKARNQRAATIFVFHTDEFWLNLHHFLYVLGRAENKERDAAREAVAAAPADQERGLAKLNAKDQKIWREAVTQYAAGVSKKDLVFDESLSGLTGSIMRAGSAKTLASTGIDSAVATILERVAPIYRKVWWKQHYEANQHWQKTVQVFVDRYGVKVLAFITNAYQMEWPATGFPVHLVGYSNWAGAYSTRGALLVVSSLDLGTEADYGLETIFHEGMHQWDDQIAAVMREQAKKVNKVAPRILSHALIFYTAGDAVRRVLPEHVPYAEKYGVWERMGPVKGVVEELWKPYLDGHGTRDDAFAELIKRTGTAGAPSRP